MLPRRVITLFEIVQLLEKRFLQNKLNIVIKSKEDTYQWTNIVDCLNCAPCLGELPTRVIAGVISVV